MEKSSFFNSVAGDRKYQADDFANFFNTLLTNGVLPASTNLQIISNNDMTITVKQGKAFINGYLYNNDSDLILSVDVADGVLNRLDSVVVQISTVGREIKTIIKKGVFASTPVAPTLIRNSDFYELGIATILISNGVVSISQANITDLRLDTTKCGIINSLIQADTTAIFDQYQAWFTATTGTAETDVATFEAQFQLDFTTWFNNMKDQLTVDAAGNLQTQINAIPKVYRGITTPTTPTNIDFWFQEV